MKRHQRRAYNLLIIVAILPMVATVGAIGTQLCYRATRTQRDALHHLQNEDAAARLVRQIARDARTARRAEVQRDGDTQTLELIQDNQAFIYTKRSDTVVRTLRRGPESWEESSWLLYRTDVRYRVERAGLDAPVVWITLTFEEHWKRNLNRKRRVTTAVRLAGEDER